MKKVNLGLMAVAAILGFANSAFTAKQTSTKVGIVSKGSDGGGNFWTVTPFDPNAKTCKAQLNATCSFIYTAPFVTKIYTTTTHIQSGSLVTGKVYANQ